MSLLLSTDPWSPPPVGGTGLEIDRLQRRVADLEEALGRERRRSKALMGMVGRLHRLFDGIRGVTFYIAEGDEALQLLGADAAAMLGPGRGDGSLDPAVWLAAVHPDDRTRYGAARQAAIVAGGELLIDYRYRRPGTGEECWLREHAVVSRHHAMGFVIDVTREKDQEQRLRGAMEREVLANRARTDFLASVSHELRTPLNAIIGFAELIMTEAFGPVGCDRYVEYSRDIHTSAYHLKRLIEDILDVAKAEAGRMEVRDAMLDVDHLVGSALRMVRDHAHGKGLTVTTEIDDHLPQLRADEGRMCQILLNLLSNAVKFTETGGRITVRAVERDDGGMTIAVADSGIGMAPEDIPRALEPFVQIDTGLTRQYEGTGLGLPLVCRLAKLHGGHLDLQSVPGVGTVAQVLLPPERSIRPVLLPLDDPGEPHWATHAMNADAAA